MAATRNSPEKSKNPISIRQHLRGLVLIGTCGLLIFAGVASTALLQIRVNSPLYKSISLSNNLIADYVPPYQSLLEPARLCAKLVDAPDQQSRLLYEQDLKAFQREYDAKYADYMTRVPEGPLKDMMRGEAHETALEYFKLADQLVALVNGNRMDEARTLLASTMNPLYDRHAAAVDQIVLRARQEARAAEDLAASSVRIYTAAMVTVGLLILFLEGALSWFLARGISAQTDSLAQSEESLRDSEELYRSTFDQAAVGILHVSFEGKILRCNARYAEIVGYPIEEIPGSNIQRFTPPEFRTATAEAFQQLVAAEVSRSGLEKPYLRKDGRVVWARITVSLLRDAQGKPQFAVSMVQDITEHKKAEEALHRLRQAVDASGEVVLMTDRERRITFVNPQFTRTYGYSQEEVIGKEPGQILKSEDVSDSEYEAIWQKQVTNQFIRYEIVNKTKDGHKLVMDCSANTVFDDRGETVGFISIQRDITQRRHLEQQLMQSQKMEAVGRLAGGVAHDFNNILGIITGYTELTLDDPTLAEQPKARLAEIRKAADRAVGITRQLLTFSRKQVLETKILNLNEVVQETTKMLGRLLGEDIEVAVVLDPNLGSVSADPSGIDQIILNLAVNARDAMPNGGKLTIETANTTFDRDSSTRHGMVTAGDYVVLAVSDSGVGMDAETQEHIFEPFYTTKEEGRGTGLGLSMVLGIVEQSGGSIWTYSEIGCGTTFKIYLPRAAAAGQNVTSEITETIRGGGETILLVEDDPGVRKLNVELLRSLGYNVIEAGDGAEALGIMERYPDRLDLLLTDVVMPGMNGYRLSELLSESRPGLRVLFVSGYTETAVATQIADSGAVFLQKPFARNALAAKLREVLDAPARQEME